MYRCKCGREFEKKQSYVAHCGHCSIHLGRDPVDRFGDSRAWSRGRTKDTDERVLRNAQKNQEHPGNFLGHTHKDETKRVISEKARYNAKHHRNGWKAGSSKIPNKYEEFTEQFLQSRGIKYSREFVVAQSLLGKKGSYYQLDFLVNDYIDLEIDGSSHDNFHDSERDHYVSKLYQVYRINHNDSIEELEIKLNKFVSTVL